MKNGNIFMSIIVIYLIFIFLYGIVIIAVSEGLSASASKDMAGARAGNITKIGNMTIEQQYKSIEDASVCSQNDVIGCVNSVMGYMFSLDAVKTPFAYFNYVTIIFSMLFLVAVIKEIGIPLMEAIVPF